MLPLMPKAGIDRLADVPIRWLVLGFLIYVIWIFVSLSTRNYEDRNFRRTEGRTLRVAVGQEFELILQTIGPGKYKSPPSISDNSSKSASVAGSMTTFSLTVCIAYSRN